MKSRIKNHLSLTKKEWNGMVVLVVLIAVVLAAPYVYRYFHKDEPVNFKDFDKAVALLPKTDTDSTGNKSTSVYREKGAKAFIANKLKPGVTIELNSADSTKLTQVHGIGAGFAMRIIRYRERLGGFVKLQQLKEVYGLDSAKYAEIAPQLTLNAGTVVRMNINTVSFATLSQNPYLKYKQCSAIIEYRQQHGNYNSIADLQNVAILTTDVIQKIEPYIKFK